MTAEPNGRLRRVIVNRLWARLLGRGLVEPLDDLDQPAWNADLLDWLADDLTTNKHDLKHTLRLICTSRAYQLPSREAGEGAFVFRGPVPKRLQSEQFVDALSALSGQWQNSRAFQRLDGRKQGGQIGAVNGVLAEHATKPTPPATGKPPAPVWIWDQRNAATSAPLETIYLRKTITLKEALKSAPSIATSDNEFALFVNGRRVIESKNWATPVKFDIAKHLRPGRNVIAVQATNIPPAPRALFCAPSLETPGCSPMTHGSSPNRSTPTGTLRISRPKDGNTPP